MPKLDLNKINPLTLALITFVVLGAAVLFARFIFPALIAPVVETAEDAGIQLDTLPVLPTQKTKFAGFEFDLPDKWSISYALSSDSNFDWKCLQGKECQLMVITHDSDGAKLKQVVISTPVGSRYEWTGQKKIEHEKLKTSDGEINFTVEKYLTIDNEADVSAEATTYVQLFGCNSAFVCLNSGLLDFDEDVNAAQVAEFKQFLLDLKLQKV